MRNTKTDHDLRLIFDQKTTDFSGTKLSKIHSVTGYFALETPDGMRYGPALENINGLNLEGLEVHAQINSGSAEQGSGFYGSGLAYGTVYSVNLVRAEEMVDTLKKLQRKLQGLNEKLGHPESFGAYVARVCAVLGVSQVGLYREDKSEWANGEKIRWFKPGDAVYQFAGVERDIRKQYQAEEVPSHA